MRLIDADELRKCAIPCEIHNGALTDLCVPLYQIDSAPTAEERPQCEWEIVDVEGGKIWNCVCTNCGHDPQDYICGTENWWLRKPLPNFCPNCGARIVNVKGGAE